MRIVFRVKTSDLTRILCHTRGKSPILKKKSQVMTFPSPTYIRNKTADSNINIALYEAGPKDGPAVLMIHGWPEIAYSWTHQITALANAGYRAIAMDVRGFGNSSNPKDKTEYHITKIVGDVEAVLDGLDIDQAVLLGHDWGGIIVWHAARMIESRVKGVISICTPHMARPPVDPILIFKNRHGKDHYFVRFQEQGEAEALFARDPRAFFNLMFQHTPRNAKPSHKMYYILNRFAHYLDAGTPPIKDNVMGDTDIAIFADAYTKSGFHGGVNLYRNTTANWEYGATLSDQITQPSLMLSADRDLFLPPEMSEPMVNMIPDLERKIIKDCGHWAMWEQPDAIKAAILDWLVRKF